MYTFICLQRFVFFYVEGFNFLCEDSTVVCLLMFSLPLTSSASMSHTETQAKSAIVQKLHRVIKCKRWVSSWRALCHHRHMSKWERQRGQWSSMGKQRQGWCLLFLPPCRFACLRQKRKASSHVCTVCAFQVCTLLLCCLCTCLCMPFSDQTMWFACVGVSQQFVYRTVWVSGCTSRLSEIWTFRPVLVLFYHSSLPLTYTHNRWDEGMGGVPEEGSEMGGLFFFFFSLRLCAPSLSCLIPPLRSTWQLFPKVREQSPFWGEEVELSPVLQFISFPLRFTAVSWSTPLHENPQAAMGSDAHTRTYVHTCMGSDMHTYHRHSIIQHIHLYMSTLSVHLCLWKKRKHGEDELWNIGESWIKDWTKNAAMKHKQPRFKQLLFWKFTVLQAWPQYFSPSMSVRRPQNIFQPLSFITCWMVCQLR